MRVHRIGVPLLVLACVASGLAGSAAAEPRHVRPTEPRIPIATPEPVLFDLALNEVELHWRTIPGGSRTPLVSTGGVLGASLVAQRGGRAVITMAKVETAAELRRVAVALQVANPGALVEPVFYEPGPPRAASTRRVGTNTVRLFLDIGTGLELVVGAAAATARRVADRPGEYVLETSDPLAALELTTTLRGRRGVRSVGLSAIPTRVLQKFERLVAAGPGPPRFDEPQEAQEFFALKRQPVGQTAIPVERYQTALEHMKRMPRRSTRTGLVLPPGPDAGLAPGTAILSSWTPLGPGNIGGRTRGFVIDPNGTTMYAAGVAGGVWKSTNAGASWTPTADLIANLAVNALAMDPTDSNILYAGTGEGYFNFDAVRGNGIFVTTNAAGSWTQLASTATADFRFVNKIVVSPNTPSRLYAATRTGILRSPDSGATWTKVLDATTAFGCTDLAIRTDQANDYMFAACGASSVAQGTVYRNTDAGGAGSWTPVLGVALGEPGMARTSLAIAPSNQNVVYALAASNTTSGDFAHGGLHAVFRSTDGGTTWPARVRNTSSTKLNTVLLTNPVFAFNFECLGRTNTFSNQGWYDNVIAVDPLDPDRVWVGGIDLFRSDDGGANWGIASFWWASASNPHFVHADQHAIVFHPSYNGTTNTIMFVGNDGGLFRTADARAATATGPTAPCNTANASVTWTTLNNGYGVTQFYHGLPYPGGTTYLGGTQDNGTVRGTDSNGPNVWSEILGGDGGYVAVDPNNPNVVYAETQRLAIRKSTNGGTSFVLAINGITEPGGNFLFINPFIMDPSDPQRLWTGGFSMWRTTNGASSWTQASDLTCGNKSVSAIAVAPTNPNRVVSGMSDGCINFTTSGLTATGTTTWSTSQPPGTTGAFVSWIAFDPADENVIYATYSTFGVPHVWKSTNGGLTWTAIDGTGVARIPDVPVHTIVVDPANPARLFVGTDVGVFNSDDGGATWAVENTGFANVITEALAIGNVGATPHVFAFTHGRGAWRVPMAAPSTQLVVTPIMNATTFSPGKTLDLAVVANNPGLPIVVDFYVGGLLPDGNTIVFLTEGSTAMAFGSLSNLGSFRPVMTGSSLATAFDTTLLTFSYTWQGTEPTGTWTAFVAAFRSGSTELVGRGQVFFTVSP